MVHDILVCCEQAIIAADFVLGVSCLSLNYFSELTSIGAEARKRRGFCLLLGTEGHRLYGNKDLEHQAS